MAQSRVQFSSGLETKYILQGGIAKPGADVAFKSTFLNNIYFAKDTGVIYVNGKRYGYCNSLDVSNFSDVFYSYPTNTNGAKLLFKDNDGNEIKEVSLFRMYSGTPSAISVEVDENNDYKISFNSKNILKSDTTDSSNAIVTDDDGQLGVYLGMEHDASNNIINFVTYDNDGNKRVFGAVEEGKYMKNTFLERVSVKTIIKDGEDVSVLRFEWNEDVTNNGLDKTVIDIPFEEMVSGVVEEYRSFTINGKKLTTNPVLDGTDISVGFSEILPDEDGVYHYEYDVDDSISKAFAKIDHRIGETAKDSSVVKIIEDLEQLSKDVNNLKLISNITIDGDLDGDFVIDVSNNNDTSTITVTKGVVANSNLVGYETSTGLFDPTFTINSAFRELDESLSWKIAETTEEKS